MVKSKLIIVESPAKCGKIEEFLGIGYKCMATYGHLRTLNNLKNIDFSNNFFPTFTIMENKKKQIKLLNNAINNSDEVILATDNDREGEAIAWHICMIFNLPLKTTKRIIFKEITKTAIDMAVKNPSIININLVYAQHCRQIIDLIVGFKISPILWNNITRNSKDGLSAGRCQTPALKLVYDNYKEIEKSPGTIVYNLNGMFTNKNIVFTLSKSLSNKEEVKNFLENSIHFNHIFSREKEKQVSRKPPQPFTTSSLQQMANTELRCSPKDTMRICQRLYEAGYITYMRTDSKTYNKEFIDNIKKYIQETWEEKYINPEINKLTERKQAKNKKKPEAQEAHEAIRPTNIKLTSISKDMTQKEIKMYNLIWRNTCQSCMSPAVYSQIVSKITAPNKLYYKCITEEVIFLGWHVLNNKSEKDKYYSYLKNIKNNEILQYNNITAKTSLKDSKLHFTEAKLVSMLEERGIGRPSTFSGLVEKIQERKYVKRTNINGKKVNCEEYTLLKNNIETKLVEKEFGNEKNKLVIQPLGIIVIDFLFKHFDRVFTYDYTKIMEDTLDEIANGKSSWQQLCFNCNNEIEITSKKLISDKVCITIDSEHSYIIGKYGPVIKYTNPNSKEVSFKKVKSNISISKLKRGEYKLDEVLEDVNNKGTLLGKYEKEDLFLKKGQFGLYVTWGDNKRSIQSINIDETDITLENVIQYLSNKSNILRVISDTINIRNGKYGEYIFIKKPEMKKPKFIGLSGFKHDIYQCDIKEIMDWISEKK